MSAEVVEIRPEVEEQPPEVAPEQTIEELQARVEELETQLVTAGRTMIEFRAKVRTEAMAMAQQHNLCGVVEQTLRKVGIDIERVTVEVVDTFERVRRYQVPKELMDAINDQGFINFAMHGQIPRGHSHRDFRAVQAVANNEQRVGEISLRTVANPLEQVGIPAGYIGAYASNDGRVMHLIPWDGEAPAPNYLGEYDREVRRLIAVCGSAGHWRPHSTRAEGRICGRCVR